MFYCCLRIFFGVLCFKYNSNYSAKVIINTDNEKYINCCFQSLQLVKKFNFKLDYLNKNLFQKNSETFCFFQITTFSTSESHTRL